MISFTFEFWILNLTIILWHLITGKSEDLKENMEWNDKQNILLKNIRLLNYFTLQDPSFSKIIKLFYIMVYWFSIENTFLFVF
jgi:hypothetical protein